MVKGKLSENPYFLKEIYSEINNGKTVIIMVNSKIVKVSMENNNIKVEDYVKENT